MSCLCWKPIQNADANTYNALFILQISLRNENPNSSVVFGYGDELQRRVWQTDL